MSERLEGDRGTWDQAGGGDHNEDYKFGNPGVVLSWHERMNLRRKIDPREIERRRQLDRGMKNRNERKGK